MNLRRNPINGWIVASVPPPSDHPYKGWVSCMDWCIATFSDNTDEYGNPSRSCGKNWRYVGEGVFEFRRVDQHLMFLLRWA